MSTIQFLGGALTVTGSKYLISTPTNQILVDCGMFQGLKSLRLKNWDHFPVDPSKIDAVVLTHAHIDHSGYIPRFIKEGFKGKIYCTPATRDLCEILLPDAGHLSEEEADYLNRHRKSKHDPALPFFTMEDGQNALERFEPVEFKTQKKISSDISFEFNYAGHILGAASVSMKVEDKKLFFTGDIGRPQDPVFFPPQPPSQCDYLITESTYGSRRHSKTDTLADLASAILEIAAKNGVLIIPSFAVGRAQEIMYYLWQLKKQNRIPNIPIFLNSPMAANVNKLFIKYHEHHKLSAKDSEEVCGIAEYVRSVEESKALNERQGPMIIISASGMMTGGRVLHHIKKFGPDPKNMILLVGFQAAGTRGESLERGATEIKIHGEYVPIQAHVRTLENMSAHADYQEILDLFADSQAKPKTVFITHGEPSATDSMRTRITDRFGWKCVIPEQNQKVELS